MKCLTVTQPWASLIAIGAKRIESRSWSTSYRGPLAIHAAKGFPRWAKETCWRDPFDEILRTKFGDGTSWAQILPTILPVGKVIAIARLTNVLPAEVVDNVGNVFDTCLDPLSEQEKAFGDYTPGRFAWILEDVKALEKPVLAKGALGLWNWEPGELPR